MEKDHFAESYQTLGNAPETWEMQADQLGVAAEVLRKAREKVEASGAAVDAWPSEAHTWPTELMLRGLIVENLLKAIWLKGGNVLVRNGCFVQVPEAGSGHNLVQLAKAVGQPLTPEESYLFERLSQFVLYAGRYPIPTKVHASKPQATPDGGIAVLTSWGGSDHELFETVVRRLKSSLR